MAGSNIDADSVARQVLRLIPDQVLKPEYRGKDYADRVRSILGERSRSLPGDRQGRVDPQGEIMQVVEVELVVRVSGVAHEKAPLRAVQVLVTPGPAANVEAGSDSPSSVGSSPAGAVGDPDGGRV